MVERKKWSDFRDTGLVLVSNQILHIFGWAIVFEVNSEDEVVDVYPARVKFRGFENKIVQQAYKKVSKFMVDNAEELNKEAGQ